MKSIDTLVDDIYELFSEREHIVDPERATRFGQAVSETIARRLAEERKPPFLRMSNLGTPDRKLWYTVNHPELAEPLRPEAKIKFLFGDILEELLLFLAEEAGHTVSERQKELDLFGVKGHKDATIDGVIVDCKSASTFSFNKFKSGLTPEDDSFGYLDQLNAYMSADDTSSGLGAFLAIDKTLGHIVLDKHRNTKSKSYYEKEIERKRAVLASPKPPPRCYSDVVDGKSGNRKLDVVCSYCPFKSTCWPGLRTFLYYSGPRYLTRVERLPDVPEVK
jgi:hypothetical protein